MNSSSGAFYLTTQPIHARMATGKRIACYHQHRQNGYGFGDRDRGKDSPILSPFHMMSPRLMPGEPRPTLQPAFFPIHTRIISKPTMPTTDAISFQHPSEREFAKLLDFYGIRWEYEPRTFPLEYNEDGSFKSSVDKFFDQEALKGWAEKFNAKPGDLLLILAGEADKTRKALNELRLEMGNRLELRNPDVFKPLWVVDFPLLEWDEESERWHAMHHPFTSPKPEDIELMDTDPGKVRANAYDMVINGVEIGGGSIRIHDKGLQKRMFKLLGFTDEEAQNQFGFLMNAFEYGAPPHGGIALGFDRLVALFGGSDSIRDYIAFPKNNAGRDVMIDSPAGISDKQLDELGLKIVK